MLAGQPPFTGPTAQAVIARHLGQAPASLLSVRPDLPSAVDSAVRAALEKEPARRPRSGAELLERLTR
jgi:serine/threonine-protein kinase